MPVYCRLTSSSKHCFERSALRSGLYVWVQRSVSYTAQTLTDGFRAWDFALLAAIYSATKYAEARLSDLEYPHPALAQLAWITLWALYSYASGLVATGLWVIAHGP